MIDSETRDKVIDLESYPEELKESIRERIRFTTERPFKPWERPLYTVIWVIVGMFLLGLGILLFTNFKTLSQASSYIHVGIVFTALLLCWLLMSLAMALRKGRVEVRKESIFIYVAACLPLFWIVSKMLIGELIDGADLAVLIVFGVCVICVSGYTSELRLREHVLRNELALAELTELVNRRNEKDIV